MYSVLAEVTECKNPYNLYYLFTIYYYTFDVFCLRYPNIMCECWKYKASDRPTFALLKTYMEDALTRQCPDLSLIPRFEGEVIPRNIGQPKPSTTFERETKLGEPPVWSNENVTPTAPPYTLVSASKIWYFCLGFFLAHLHVHG